MSERSKLSVLPVHLPWMRPPSFWPGSICHLPPVRVDRLIQRRLGISSDPEEVELRACLRAAKVAKEMALDKVELETDCLGVVSKLKSMEIDRSLQGPLVEEIKRELRSLADHRVR
jgi:hypothetical protein